MNKELFKKSFVLYVDFKPQLEKLSDQQAGILIKCIFDYHETGSYSTSDLIVEFAMTGLIEQFKRDSEKWQVIKNKRVESGKIGGLAKASKCKQDLANVANAKSAKQTLANVAVSDSVSVSVSDSNNISSDSDFEKAWELYRKKGNKKSALRRWNLLSKSDREAVIAKIPEYVASRSDKVYQKDFEGYLNSKNRHWEDEIVVQKAQNQSQDITVNKTEADFMEGWK